MSQKGVDEVKFLIFLGVVYLGLCVWSRITSDPKKKKEQEPAPSEPTHFRDDDDSPDPFQFGY